mmetsp:Transcript_39368/g.108514  ORF Transcript_39368/g.108514 Transcript_39368/m.108514 type:complete len:247 (-) Transcript_39368:99-839(-)
MLSSANDPFYVARNEVQDAIVKVGRMHDEWSRLLKTENTFTCKQFQELHTEIAGELQQLDCDFDEISRAITAIEENPDRFRHVDANELRERKDFVRSSRAAAKAIEDSVRGQQALTKMQADRRAAEASKAAAYDRQQRMQRDNQENLELQRQQQQQIMRHQDDMLEELSKSASRLKETSVTIGRELQEHNSMLEELDQDIDRETEKLNFVMKRMGRLLKTGDSKQLCVIIALIALLMVLLFFVINT